MEKTKQKELAGGVLVYAIGTFGTKFLSFLIVPLYTYYISTTDMGIYDILVSTVSLLAPLITLQISDAAYKWLLQEEQIEEHIRSTIQVLFINCSLAAALVFLINQYMPIPYCTYFAIILIMTRMLETLQKLLRGLKNQKLFAVSGIVYSVVFLSLNLIQIVYLRKGVTGLFNSAITANLVAIIFIFLIEKRLRVRLFEAFDSKMIKKMLKFSIPLIPNYMNWWIINSSNKYIVNIFLGTSSNGILAVAHKFPSFLQTVFGLFNNSWQDISIAEKQTDKIYNTNVFRWLYRFALGLLIPLIPFTKILILLIMGADYKSSCNFIPFFYLGTAFQAFSSFYGVGYLRNNQTKKAFFTSAIGAAVNAVADFCLIRLIGLYAPGISTFLGFMVMWFLREEQNKKELGITLRWMEFFILILTCIIIALLSINFGMKMNMVLLFLGLIIFFILNKEFILKTFRTVSSKILKTGFIFQK